MPPRFHVPHDLVSDPDDFTIHAYFDLCPESPDGTRVVLSRFPDRWPGRTYREGANGEVLIRDLESGSETDLGTFAYADGHSGPHAQWLSDHSVGYQDVTKAIIVNLRTQETAALNGGLHFYHPDVGGLFTPRAHDTGMPLEDGLYHLDVLTGATRAIVTRDKLRAFCHGDGIPADNSDWTVHAKASPSGERVAVLHRVLWTPEHGERIMRIFTCRPDGSDLRLFPYRKNGYDSKPLHWNFWDDESIYGYSPAEEGMPCQRWDLDGNYLETLHTGDGNHGAVSPDHRWIATDSFYHKEQLSLYLYPVGASEGTLLFEGPKPVGPDAHPVFSRDGKAVYANLFLTENGPSVVARLDLSALVGD